MSSFPNELTPLKRILTAWTRGQLTLPMVDRWSNYANPAVGGRPQNSLQHTNSMMWLACIVLRRLTPYSAGPLDQNLIMTALAVHDLGEAEVGHDTLQIDKTVAKDIREYEAFRDCYKHLGEEFPFQEQAYLLQFCLQEDLSDWPPYAKMAMEALKQARQQEAFIFQAIERLDYVLYVLEVLNETGNIMPLVQVLRHQLRHLELYTTIIPGFYEEFWTPEIMAWCQILLRKHEGQFVEQKST